MRTRHRPTASVNTAHHQSLSSSRVVRYLSRDFSFDGGSGFLVAQFCGYIRCNLLACRLCGVSPVNSSKWYSGRTGDEFFILEEGSCNACINGDHGEKLVKTYSGRCVAQQSWLCWATRNERLRKELSLQVSNVQVLSLQCFGSHLG